MIAIVDASIDIDLMPQYELKRFCRRINEAVDKFYEDPKNMAEFEAWHAAYLAEKEAGA